jgi:hypothetical protein
MFAVKTVSESRFYASPGMKINGALPTYDLDFTVALGRERLQEFFDRAIDAGYSA